jgi:crossover junction endodeoxyribonuclease RuvC
MVRSATEEREVSGIVLGIDPGLSGALCFLHSSGEVILCDMPTLSVGKSKRRLDLPTMRAHLATRRDDLEHIVLEQQQPMRGQGVTSTFSTGRGQGVWEGMIEMLGGVPSTIVRAQTWQRELGVPKKSGKAGTYEVVSRLFPTVVDELRGPKGGLKDGRVDALALAVYGRRLIQNSPSEAREGVPGRFSEQGGA